MVSPHGSDQWGTRPSLRKRLRTGFEPSFLVLRPWGESWWRRTPSSDSPEVRVYTSHRWMVKVWGISHWFAAQSRRCPETCSADVFLTPSSILHCVRMACSSDAPHQTPITKHTNRSFDGLPTRLWPMGHAAQPPKTAPNGVRTHFFGFATLGRELVASDPVE